MRVRVTSLSLLGTHTARALTISLSVVSLRARALRLRHVLRSVLS